MKGTWLKNVGLLFVAFSLLLNPLSATPAYALSAPTLIAPANGSTTTVITSPPLAIPEFQWAAVSGATSYRIQVSTDIAFTVLDVNVQTTNTTYTHYQASDLPDGPLYWRVRVETPAPVSSYTTWSFVKQWASPSNLPTLTSPANGATIDFYDSPIFSWSTVTGAAYYKIQIYSSPGGWSTPDYQYWTISTTHQPRFKLTNGTYYWRVIPYDGGDFAGSPSVERSFVESYYNFLPNLLEPANGATPTFTPTFRWQAVRGAHSYLLQYTTDPSFGSGINQIETANTAFTPYGTLPNDVNYYWRVRANSGSSTSNWTPTRTFIKKWYIKPVLLTPTNLYQHVRFPLFSWTPVPGASYYNVEFSLYPGFVPPLESGTTANTFYTPHFYSGATSTVYWRVTPYDGGGGPTGYNTGVTSNTSSFVSYGSSVAPRLVYPLFYYPPDSYAGFPGVTTNPHEDRTTALPIFIWNRVYNSSGQVYAQAYRVQVSTDPTFSITPDWTVDTENLVAAPTASNPFTPVINTNYYWRVCPLVGTTCAPWSEIWKARFDPSLGLPPTSGAAPALIRPTNGFEYAETTPLLEWFPFSGATAYDVQISLDQNFASTVDTATVSSPAYVPTQSLAQRSLGDVNFGVYYWRVRQSPSGTWSETRRFQIAAQSQWQHTRTLGDTLNRLQIGSDPAGDVPANYDLTSLQVAQDSDFWYFGFQVPAAPTQNVTYALYLDLDHQDNSGADSDARGYTISTLPAYHPEYMIYVLQQAGAYAANKVYLYHWNGSGWDTVNILSDIGGSLNKNGNYLEIQVPNTAIGYQDTTGSYTASLLSLPASSGQPQDSVPSDPNVPGVGAISRFANVTERMNLSIPPSTVSGDPTAYPSILPFFWDWPVLAPWSGAIMEAHLDPAFTSLQATYTLTSTSPYYADTSHAWSGDFNGDNTYYWRIRPRYENGGAYSGVWSQGWRFQRKGFLAQNLTTSVTFATPTFSWDMVEGAEAYQLQVDNDLNFSSPSIDIFTRQNSYTHASTLDQATYYWRVRVYRNGNVAGDWTPPQNFTLALPTPIGLYQIPSGVAARVPTLCWTPVIKNSPAGDPVFAAYAYRVQVSKDPTFSPPLYETVDTEQSCWTSTYGYDDGPYYWRVAVIDGNLRLGNFSAPATYTKQYPVTTLVSPVSGSSSNTTPTFVWTPVDGTRKYKFQSSLFPTFSPVYEDWITSNCRWTPVATYAPGHTYYWRVAIIDQNDKIGPYVGATLILTDPNPVVNSITLANDNPTNLTSVNYNVLFSQAVTGVDTADFSLAVGGTITGASIANVSGSGSNYTVTVNTGTGNGTLRLDLIANGTIVNVNSTPLTTSFTSGEVYIVVKGGLLISGNAGVGGANLTYTDGTPQTITADTSGVYNLVVSSGWSGTITPWKSGYGFTPASRSYSNVSTNMGGQNYTATACSTTDVSIGAGSYGAYCLTTSQSTRQSYLNANDGPVKINNTGAVSVLGSERILYYANGIPASFTEMMGVPASQLSTTYWFPWYKNIAGDLDTQLRIANVSGLPATVHVYIGGTEMSGSPFTLTASGSGQGTRLNFAGVNAGPVRVASDVNIVAAERIIYYVNSTPTSFIEMMGLPDNQLNNTYWLPWYKNVGELDTQLRIANVSGATATVHIYIGGTEMTGSPFTLTTSGTGQSKRLNFAGINNGPVKIVSNVNIVASERLLYYDTAGVPTSFTEIMAVPNSQLNTTWWLPWYKNTPGDIDTQLRIGNVSGSTATVHIYIGGAEMTGSPFTLTATGAGQSTRLNFAGINNGPVRIVSNVNIVASERILYYANGIPTSFIEMLGLQNNQLSATYWLPWYKDMGEIDTQLRLGVP